jgi:predicted RNA binding protein YcfA (HicA-like mRNA interferase family)
MASQTMNKKKLLEKILTGSKNVSFNDFIALVEAFGFELARTRGSHHIFQHAGIPEVLNLQNSNGQVKPYQIRLFLQLVEQYNLKLEE